MIFKEPHVRLILEGKKTATRRLKGRWLVGSIQPVKTQYFEKARARIRILRKYRQPLGAMTESDARKEGGYTLREFRQIWREIHGSWDAELEVWVYEFTLVSRKTSDGVTHGVPFAQFKYVSTMQRYTPSNLWDNLGRCVVCQGRVRGHYAISELAFFECDGCGAVYSTAGDLTHSPLLEKLPDLEEAGA